jgi:hypothetical protein
MRDMKYFTPVKQAMEKAIKAILEIKRIDLLLKLTPERLEIYCRDDKGIDSLRAKGRGLLQDDPHLNHLVATRDLNEFHLKLKEKLCCYPNIDANTLKKIKCGRELFEEYNSITSANIASLSYAININQLDLLMTNFKKNWQIIEKVNSIVNTEDIIEITTSPRENYDFGVELLTDENMLTMIERGIRGGYSGLLGDRYAKANNKYMKDAKGERSDYDASKPPSYIQYIDANNLYGWSMMNKMPYNDFKWITLEELSALCSKAKSGDKAAINYNKTHGLIWEVDLQYTKEAKKKTWKYPLAPVNKEIKENELKQWQKDYRKENGIVSTNKLILDCHDKERYVVHQRVLNFYLRQGMKVAKVHRIISFREESWLKPYIEFNTAQRTIATTEFEKDIYKLLNNSFFGKTCENVRKRSNVSIETDPDKVMRMHRQCNYMSEIIFSEDITAVQMRKTSLKFDKPIFIGMTVLDEAKRCMYETYYDRVLKSFPNAVVLGGDTDSLVLYIETEDLYQDMKDHMDEFDLSEYPKDNSAYFKLKTEKERLEYKDKYGHLFTQWNEIEKCFLYSEFNKKVPGLPKDEELGYLIKEFVYLRAKQYWYSVQGKKEEKKRLKGCTKSVVKKMITGKDYKAAIGINIDGSRCHVGKLSVNMKQIQSEQHRMYIKNIHKNALDKYDDKRFICNDLITTFPFGLEDVEDEIFINGRSIAELKRM